jgi:hydroxymethylpyrimidine pyrophosphatase-like HAD family hydrolase
MVLSQALGDTCEVVVMQAWGKKPIPWLVTVMPRMAGKGHAAHYVQAEMGVAPEDCICAGDTKVSRLKSFLEISIEPVQNQ